MSPGRVLLVDDDPGFQELTSICLQRVHPGTRLDWLASAPELEALCHPAGVAAAPPYDALLLDRTLDLDDGLALIPLCRESPALGSVRIVVLTDSADPRVREEALRLGADEHLRKPMLLAEYREFLSGLLPAR